MGDYVRSSDAKLEELMTLVREIHQRQNERTIPAIEKIEKTVYGNGKKGLCDEVNEIKTAMATIKWLSGLAISLLGLFFVFVNFILKH